MLILPLTSNFSLGCDLPIPTLPFCNIFKIVLLLILSSYIFTISTKLPFEKILNFPAIFKMSLW